MYIYEELVLGANSRCSIRGNGRSDEQVNVIVSGLSSFPEIKRNRINDEALAEMRHSLKGSRELLLCRVDANTKDTTKDTVKPTQQSSQLLVMAYFTRILESAKNTTKHTMKDTTRGRGNLAFFYWREEVRVEGRAEGQIRHIVIGVFATYFATYNTNY